MKTFLEFNVNNIFNLTRTNCEMILHLRNTFIIKYLYKLKNFIVLKIWDQLSNLPVGIQQKLKALKSGWIVKQLLQSTCASNRVEDLDSAIGIAKAV